MQRSERRAAARQEPAEQDPGDPEYVEEENGGFEGGVGVHGCVESRVERDQLTSSNRASPIYASRCLGQEERIGSNSATQVAQLLHQHPLAPKEMFPWRYILSLNIQQHISAVSLTRLGKPPGRLLLPGKPS